jgi:hypothetical protein
VVAQKRVLSYHRSFQRKDVRIAVRPHLWHIAGLAASFVILSSPVIWTRSHGREPSYVPATIALTLVLVASVLRWRRVTPDPVARRSRDLLPFLVGAVASVIVAAGACRWIERILANPIDPIHGDMLPVIAAVLHRALKGLDPYSIYHVPWEAPLGYGPVLWTPYFVPYFLHADLRLITLFGALVLPIWCAGAAVLETMRRDVVAAAIWLVLTTTILVNPDLTTFMIVGHTPSYWPLLPLFAWLATAERWRAAALVLGLVVVGRSTMVAGVPIFLMSVWLKDHREGWIALLLCIAPVIALMAPFAIWDPHALWYGMVAVYPRVIKEAIWSDPGGAIAHTIGITGWLVSHHLERFVEVMQACAVLGLWGIAWVAIRRGARPLPWMGLAVFVFCMTTLWPLYYIYFDVLVFFVSAAVAETIVSTSAGSVTAAWLGSMALAAAAVALALGITTTRYPHVDFESADSRRWLYQGFAYSRAEGEPALPWIWGYDAVVSLPRRSTSPALIVITVNPVVPPEGPPQRVTAFLNGRPLGSVEAARGWQSLRFAAPSLAWTIGANELKLVCTTSTPPILIGMSDDPRHLALAIRRIDVIPRDDRSSSAASAR